jgi:sugar/nucleoside kinase (ribokinase family)
MFDVVSIGNATMDVFIELEAKAKGNYLALPCGSKQEAKGIFYATGGGATNTAVGFARLGLRTGILAAIGKDDSGKAVLRELEKEGVDTSLVVKLPEFKTAYSAIITGKGIDRIILTYGGATTHLRKTSDINWGRLGKSRWFYVSSFHSKLALCKKIFAFARKRGVGVAWNPGKSELKMGLKALAGLLRNTSVLLLNGEEAELLTGKSGVRENLVRLQEFVPTVVITRGKGGSEAFDGKGFYSEGTRKVKVTDRTGAGDAFNVGFITAMVWGKGIKKALQLGARNAEAVLVAMGAKNNLLTKKQARKYT